MLQTTTLRTPGGRGPGAALTTTGSPSSAQTSSTSATEVTARVIGVAIPAASAAAASATLSSSRSIDPGGSTGNVQTSASGSACSWRKAAEASSVGTAIERPYRSAIERRDAIPSAAGSQAR